jgi:hypothetical protein
MGDLLVCCLCNYKGLSEFDLEAHIDYSHSDIFSTSNQFIDIKTEKVIEMTETEKVIDREGSMTPKASYHLPNCHCKPKNKRTQIKFKRCRKISIRSLATPKITCGDYKRFRKMISRSIQMTFKNGERRRNILSHFFRLDSEKEERRRKIISQVFNTDSKNSSEPIEQQSIVNEDPRPLFICRQCLTYFPTEEILQSHQWTCDQFQEKFDAVAKQLKDLKDKFEKNGASSAKQIKLLQKQSHRQTKQIKNLEEENLFSQRLREADDEENTIHPKDMQMAAIIFMVGFTFEKSKNKKMQAEEYFDYLFPGNSFVVTKVRKVGKGDSNHHVSLSASDAANKLLLQYRCLLPKDNQTNILRVTSQETAVRFKILTVIAIKLDKRYGTNKPYVDYVKLKPHLFVFKEGAYKQYRFSAAVQKFRAFIDQSDLEDVHKFTVLKNIKGVSLRQFIVL